MTAIVTTDGMACPLRRAGLAGRILASGVAGLVAWEAFSRLIAPLWIGGPLDAAALIQMSLGISGIPAEMLHLLTGLVFFPGAYVLLVQPVARRIVPGLPWPVLGLAYGVGLWVFAMFVMASLVGGAPAFLGFQPVTWASLAGHLAMTLSFAGIAALPVALAVR